MRRAAVGVLAVFIGALVLSSVAEARVGGGGSSGSRGSRSYSAPRAPSSPVTPSSPARPSTPSQSGSPFGQRPGGFFGGLGGMLGGFLLGGLLGSLLFGGLGAGLGAGIGLLDIVLMAGLAFLLYSFFRRRAMQPATAAGYAPAGWTPAPGGASADGGVATAAPAATPASADDEDLTRGLTNLRSMDPAFDPARFLDVAKDLFARLQIGWSGGDLAAVRAFLTDEMAVALEGDLSRLRSERRGNRIEQVRVDSVELTEAWQEYGRDLVTARIKANALDYTVDLGSGALVEGSKTVPTTFTEYWTFVRPVGPNPWKVSAIQQPPA